MKTPPVGMAGRLARAFIDSKLTPLLMVTAVGLGAFAVTALPREEEPQIVVPMVDVFAEMPGASPEEVEQRVTRPIEALLWEVPGIEYVYSTSSQDRALVIARFRVGENEEDAIGRLTRKLAAHSDRLPPGVTPPVIKPRSIDDVPVLALTLWGPRYDDFMLRQLAAQLHEAVKDVDNVSEVTVIGGPRREIRVELDGAAMSTADVDPLVVHRAILQANQTVAGESPVERASEVPLTAGGTLVSAADVAQVVVANRTGQAVRVRDVAHVVDGDGEPTSYVRFHAKDTGTHPAVTLAIAKRRGANAITVAHAVEARFATLRGSLLPSDLHVTITRNYGETAAEKSNELLYHMFLAVVSVSALMWVALGRREAVVVLVAIPVTLALTLFTFFLYGYTLNRITLFALIFSIGILVDDAIVVVENVVRHARLATGREAGAFEALTVRAVDEVGNPTILATLTVVAAILPMAFVGGLMGPYMRPIPVGASSAMVFSLAVAFIVTPWAAVRLLRGRPHHAHGHEDLLTRQYRKLMHRLLTEPRVRAMFVVGLIVLLVGAASFVPLGLVTVKMLPFDNKSEFQVVIDMPEGTVLEDTARVTEALASAVIDDPLVTHVQSYVGLASPYNFNGLVRHYFLRSGPHVADLQVNLRPKAERAEQSHDIAKRLRHRLVPIAEKFGATLQVAEVPPGPPVLQTLVAEVYGEDPARRIALADDIREVFRQTTGVVDVDWYVEEARTETRLVVDQEKASAAGLSAAAVARVVRMATSGEGAGLIHDPRAREDVPIVLRLPRAARSWHAIDAIRVAGSRAVPIGELTTRETREYPRSIYHKNLRPVTYVIADMAGEAESPVYAILDMNERLRHFTLPEGYTFEVFNATQPTDSTKYAMKWDGEWHITYEVFRDLGFAFAIVLVLIYVLVVGWFQSLGTPFTIMAAIPFSLVGILPAHAALGAFFTATSMIGFIAGAGIVVRNSIILVDFIELRLAEGMSLEEAVVDAGAARFRPMALTAAAVVVGAAVILFDPIFQGLAISLMAGEVASLMLSRVAVPVLYFMTHRAAPAAANSTTSPVVPA